MNKKKLGIVIVLLVVIAALVAVYCLTRPETFAGQKRFTLEVVHSDGTTKEIACKSHLEYVGEALQKEGIIEGEEGPYGLYIQVVDGEKAVFEEDGAYWGFFIDGEYAMTGIDQTPIEEGKVYTLAYTVDSQS